MLPHLINALALLATALSHPTSFSGILPRQTFGGAGECENEWVTSTVTSDTTSWSPVYVADGESCTSDALEECTVGETYTKSFSITVEAGVDIDLYVPDSLTIRTLYSFLSSSLLTYAPPLALKPSASTAPYPTPPLQQPATQLGNRAHQAAMSAASPTPTTSPMSPVSRVTQSLVIAPPPAMLWAPSLMRLRRR